MRTARVIVAFAGMMVFVGSAKADVVIQATVDGMIETIGSLSAAVNPGNAGGVIGTFTFTAPYGALDQWYDFQWVNVETGYQNPVGTAQANDPVLGKLPAIDPQPPPTNPNEDNLPFYYNSSEWLPPGQTFGGVVIHQEGVSSSFVDRPSDGNKNSEIFFTTYLVVSNVTDPNFPANTFVVIGAFDWTYTNNGSPANGMAAVTRTSGVVNGDDVSLINTAIGNAGPNGFGTWQATTDYDLMFCTPEPSTFTLLGAGIVGLAFFKRRFVPCLRAG